MVDKLIVPYIIVSLIVIIFQYWYIKKLRKAIDFAVESLRRFAVAIGSDNPAAEVERITNDIKNYK